MGRKQNMDEGRSLRPLIIFCAIVGLLITLSLSVKLFLAIKESKFDWNHQFILFLHTDPNAAKYVVFGPSDHSIAILDVKGKIEKKQLDKQLGVTTEGTVKLDGHLSKEQDIDRALLIAIFQYVKIEKSVSLYDLLRLFLFTKTVPGTKISFERITLPYHEEIQNHRIQALFLDEKIRDEAVAIEVINGTNISGVGGRIERMITILGGNVVSVATAKNEVTTTTLMTNDLSSYTSKRLGKLFGIQATQIQKNGLSDIILSVGTDSLAKSYLQ